LHDIVAIWGSYSLGIVSKKPSEYLKSTLKPSLSNSPEIISWPLYWSALILADADMVFIAVTACLPDKEAAFAIMVDAAVISPSVFCLLYFYMLISVFRLLLPFLCFQYNIQSTTTVQQ